MAFPLQRMRRLRRHPTLRRMVRETNLSVDDLVAPLFVKEGIASPAAIDSMPGVFQWPIAAVAEQARRLEGAGIPAVILFGIPGCKDALGAESWNENGVVQRAVREIKSACPDLMVITDVCFCEYTDHGHCGALGSRSDGTRDVDNDATVANLARQAVSHAQAGADIVAPSAMMDGMVEALRGALDAGGFHDAAILSYAAKFASAYYGPFRDAAESAPAFGDRRGYQMDPANPREAMREVELDVQEGADMVMVKPAVQYLDVIQRVRRQFTLPIAAYHVSGEYSCIKAAAERGWIDERRCVLETTTAIKRAGADLILTYYAPQLAQWLSVRTP